jgi:F-type H+-transporting ATPase subunit epsilon
MSYLKYSNLCADMVRAALKEPVKAKAKAREIIYYRSALWKDGVPGQTGELPRPALADAAPPPAGGAGQNRWCDDAGCCLRGAASLTRVVWCVPCSDHRHNGRTIREIKLGRRRGRPPPTGRRLCFRRRRPL